MAQTVVKVNEDDTPETLAARVLEREHEFLVEVISDISAGKIALGIPNGRADDKTEKNLF